MPHREITSDDIESLAVGAWVLGTGGGGSPYLGLLNMRALYKEGYRVQLMPAEELADDGSRPSRTWGHPSWARSGSPTAAPSLAPSI
jgi:DUF917 family protein